MKHTFEEVDREGIEALKREEFTQHDGMVIRTSAYELRRVVELLARGLSKAAIQIQMNHQSLITYGGDLAQQSRSALEVQAVWLERLEKQFPLLYPWIVIETSPLEVIVSFRAVSR